MGSVTEGKQMCGRTRSKNQSIRKKQGGRDEDRWQVWLWNCMISGSCAE